MISKISMNGIACFKRDTGIETTKKVNLIYGLNGSGKSTISSFLYNVSDSKYEGCKVDLKDDEKLIVYNQDFINDYFYSSDSLKGIFSLSKENKKIETDITEKEKELQKAQTEFQESLTKLKQAESDRITEKNQAAEKAWDIKRDHSGGDRKLEYCLQGYMGSKAMLFDYLCSLSLPPEKPDANINSLKKQVDSLVGEAASTHQIIPLIEADLDSVEKSELLHTAIVGSSNSQVSKLITKLKNSDWVLEGLGLLHNPAVKNTGTCPFCQQNTISSSLIEGLEQYFDDSYNKAVDGMKNILERYVEKTNYILAPDLFSEHPLAHPYQDEYRSIHRNLKTLIDKNIELIKSKITNPGTVVNIQSTKTIVDELNEVIKKLNNEVVAHNNKFLNKSKELEIIKEKFWKLMRWSYEQTISYWKTKDSELNSKIKALRQDKSSKSSAIEYLEKQIKNIQKSTLNIDEAINNINNGLTQLGITDFSITKYKDSLYKIIREPGSDAKFISLSEGEKMIISFLYFIEVCRGKEDANETNRKKIIVIDDPISSLSHIYVFNVGQLLKTEYFRSQHYDQVFVLTHSLYFFYELTENDRDHRHKNQSLFRLQKNTDGSVIKSMRYSEIQNDYQSYWLIVADRSQPPALIANCMRNIIEYFFSFVKKADFSNVIQFEELQNNRFQAFCRYINRESHSFGQNIFDFKEFNYEDFRDGLRLVFNVTGYSDHYEKMSKQYFSD